MIVAGSPKEKEGPLHGEAEVRGEVQDRQEQMVLPEAEVLNQPPPHYLSVLVPSCPPSRTLLYTRGSRVCGGTLSPACVPPPKISNVSAN